MDPRIEEKSHDLASTEPFADAMTWYYHVLSSIELGRFLWRIRIMRWTLPSWSFLSLHSPKRARPILTSWNAVLVLETVPVHLCVSRWLAFSRRSFVSLDLTCLREKKYLLEK